jgi:hypothetical protein
LSAIPNQNPTRFANPDPTYLWKKEIGVPPMVAV